MLCGIVNGVNFDAALSTVLRGNREADVLEFRLDQMPYLTFEQVAALKRSAEIPVIFTLRALRQGGEYKGREEDRLHMLRQWAVLQPEYLDLEYDVAGDFLQEISQIAPHAQIITSYHDFSRTPENLEAILAQMQKPEASIFKMAVFAQDACDVLRMLLFMREQADKGIKIIGISIGEDGTSSRVLAPIFGGFLSYGILDEASAPGQLPLCVMASQFRYRFLTPSTKIYGVIGDPVSGSKGEITHNAVFHQLGMDAIYVKLRVPLPSLPTFFALAKQVSIAGLSVTMPLKEMVVSYLTQPLTENAVDAINTLSFTNEEVRGINTDGVGALNAIEKCSPVADKIVAVLGAGGAAKAVAYEAKRRGAFVKIYNRHFERAQNLAKAIGVAAYPLQDFGATYDVLVNCTSVGMPSNPGCPVSPDKMIPGTTVLDCVHTAATRTPFLEAALSKRCQIVSGIDMYIEQAAAQSEYWIGADRNKAARIIQQQL